MAHRPPLVAPARALTAALALVVTAVPAMLRAQGAPGAGPKPAVRVVATGGTISNLEQGDAKRLTGEQLVRANPRLADVADVTAEQFTNVASGNITTAQWVTLAKHIDSLFRAPSAPHGIVVTHGTDTMEETAYFLDLTVPGCHPIVVTGAMRNPTMVAPDGPANLYNAVRIAASPEAEGRGTMLMLNDEIFAARDVSKTNTVRLNAFTAPGRGPIGDTDPEAIDWIRPSPHRGCDAPVVDVRGLTDLPRVDIVYSYIGADSVMIDAAVKAGAKGLVIAGVGRGGTTPGQGRALRRAAEQGVVVVVSSRTGSGTVPVRERWSAPGGAPMRGAIIGAGDLNPQKARVLLMLALTKTSDPGEIERMFAQS